MVFTASWLNENGYPYDLVSHYRQSEWLESIGHGAVVRADDTELSWKGGVYALQEQLGLPVHPGGLTALALRSHVHDINLGVEQVHLFGLPGYRLPGWFANFDWEAQVHYYTSNLFFDCDLGLAEKEQRTFSLIGPTPERAIMEALYLVPRGNSFGQVLHAMESLMGLRPKLVWKLLMSCNSVKVKRLFLYLAEELEMPWFKSIDTKKLDLGSGKRVIAGGGKYNSKYQISVPHWDTSSA